MKTETMRGRLLASTMMGGALALAMAATASAQATGGSAVQVEELVVTGSRLAQPNLVTTSPVTQVTGADIDTAGVTRVEDLVNQLPQAFAAQNATVSNGATGTATVDLRGLGAVRTLVLVDGKRLPYGSPLQGGSAPDLNQVPGQLVERVEVLTGGASAVYGSDALSGVVNFIMRKNFEGVEFDFQHAFFQHKNDYDGPGNLREVILRRAATNPSQFQLPDDNVTDGQSYEYTMIMGVNAPDGRGNITAYVGYRNNNAVLQANRDYSACAIGSATAAGGTEFTCGGSSTAFPGRFTDFATFDYTLGQNNEFIPWSGNFQYNYGPLNYYQRPDERYVLGAFGNYEITDKIEVYTQLMFMDYSTVAQIAPSGNFFSTSTINCGNPLLSASQAAAIGCTPAEIAADESTSLFIGRRNVEGGGRQSDLRYQSYRGVIGFRGDLSDNWSYDVSGQYSRVQLSQVYFNDFGVTRLGRALDVVIDPETGAPACRTAVSGVDPACVPYNIFRIGGVTQEQIDYLQIPLVRTGHTVQSVVTAAVTGDLTDYGVQSPWADRGAQLAFGAEYRRDGLETVPDISFQTGEGSGQGGATLPVSGTTEVYDLFAEIQLPLVEGRPFAELISVDGAFRWSDYRGGTSTETYKIGADWAPTRDIRFRGSYQKAVRAANVIELFTGQGFNLFDMDFDPCGQGPNGLPTATLAQCVATGVPAQFYGTAGLNSPAGQYNFLQGGNPDLAPEKGETITLGVVFTPSFVPGLNISVDWFDIEVKDLVSTYGALNIIDACYLQNLQDQCARINRNEIGQLWIGSGNVENLNTNIGSLKTRGIDVVANYGLDLETFGLADKGGLQFNFVGTWLDKLITDPGPFADPYDCAGFYANQCSSNAPPNPEWRHRFRVSWQTPWNLDISTTWRYYSEVELFELIPTTTPRVDRELAAQNYFDLAGTWQVMDNARLRFGVNNVFDNDPPLSASVGTTGNGNTYPQTYDAMGRYFFMGLTANF